MQRLLLGLALLLTFTACQQANDAVSMEDMSTESAPSAPVGVAQDGMAESAAGRAAQVPAPPPTPPPGADPNALPVQRQLIRTANVRLRVGDYDEARREVAATARRMGALVAGEQEQRLPYEVSNTLTLRVEAERFDALMDALVALGDEVEGRNVSVEDVTEQYVDLEARLRARRAVEARYEAILARASSITDVLAVEAKLSETREAIEAAEGQLRFLRDRVSLSTITLTIFERSATGLATGPGFFSRLGGAFESGWDGLLGLVVGLVALWPLALLVALAVWGWRTYRRRFPRRPRQPVATFTPPPPPPTS